MNRTFQCIQLLEQVRVFMHASRKKDFRNQNAAFGLYCVRALLRLMMCQYEPAHQMGTSSLCSFL